MPFSPEQEKVEYVALLEKHLILSPEFETRGILRYSKAKKIQQLEEAKPFHSRLRELRIEISLPDQGSEMSHYYSRGVTITEI